jgi:RNA polymerase sigma factor (sigma-70 family)
VETATYTRRLKNSQSNDQEIWRAFRAGNREAFAAIFDQHYRQLYSYGKQFLDDESMTDDAIQELFINLWRTREKLTEEVDNIKFYLFRCLRRNIRRLSDREKRFQTQDLERAADEFAHHFVTPATADGNEESLLTRRLKAIIAELPNRQREAVMLRYYENFKTEEIAVLMGVSLKTVQNTLFNAMTSLRNHSDLLKASLAIAALLLALLG